MIFTYHISKCYVSVLYWLFQGGRTVCSVASFDASFRYLFLINVQFIS